MKTSFTDLFLFFALTLLCGILFKVNDPIIDQYFNYLMNSYFLFQLNNTANDPNRIYTSVGVCFARPNQLVSSKPVTTPHFTTLVVVVHLTLFCGWYLCKWNGYQNHRNGSLGDDTKKIYTIRSSS